ncbi:MAG: phosphotransferase [Propylenella sp.]
MKLRNDRNESEQSRHALAKIPVVASAACDATITRLGGLTNLVFAVDTGDARYCLRLPGKGTESYINREVEAANARAAATARVSPEVLHFGDDGVMLTRFVEGALTMSPALFREREGAVERAARAFRKLHDDAPDFAFRFELFRMIDDYLGVLEKLGAELPEGYHDVVAEAGAVREALASHPLPLRPCHCDPLCENFLDAGDRMWIVDWEYSGMNDPMWDLGDLSVEGGFDAAMDRRLIDAYFGGPATAFDFGRMVVCKAMCDLLWTLWGLIQHANKNPADDFWAYSLNRFERCKKLMRSAEFSAHLDAVRRG